MTATRDLRSPTRLYPLRFEPLYQYRPWGGRRMADLLSSPLPFDDPVGEAWLLSDRDDHQSRVAEGSLKGWTLTELMAHAPVLLLGSRAGQFRRFPLLLKFLDVHEMLSVQVHPSDQQSDYLPAGEHGKTEAWVVLEAGAESRVYAGLQPGTTDDELRHALDKGTAVSCLASFSPKSGDGVLLPAGTVHSLGGDVMVFEVQQNSDVTFRLYDWDRVDPRTGQPRQLNVEQALACINFAEGAVGVVEPLLEEASPALRERLFDCAHFGLWRLRGELPFTVGEAAEPRVLVCIGGDGSLEHGGETYAVAKGDVVLLPASVGVCRFSPMEAATLLEVSLPESSAE